MGTQNPKCASHCFLNSPSGLFILLLLLFILAFPSPVFLIYYLVSEIHVSHSWNAKSLHSLITVGVLGLMILCWEAVLCTVPCSAASLATTYQKPVVTSSPQVVATKNISRHCQRSPVILGKIQPLFYIIYCLLHWFVVNICWFQLNSIDIFDSSWVSCWGCKKELKYAKLSSNIGVDYY